MYMIAAAVPENLTIALTPYRQKYDPAANLTPPHITVLKPFDFSGSDAALHDHLEEISEDQAPIKVSLAGWDIYRSKHYLLCLPVIAGQREFFSLRDHLLTGPLNPLAKQDTTYRPHIVFGRLANRSTIDNVKMNLKSFESQFVFRVAAIDLWQRPTSAQPWKLEKQFSLKATVASLSRTNNAVREEL